MNDLATLAQFRSAVESLPTTEPTIGALIARHAAARANWTPETDRLEHDLADEIIVRLMADYGLSKEQVRKLGDAL